MRGCINYTKISAVKIIKMKAILIYLPINKGRKFSAKGFIQRDIQQNGFSIYHYDNSKSPNEMNLKRLTPCSIRIEVIVRSIIAACVSEGGRVGEKNPSVS